MPSNQAAGHLVRVASVVRGTVMEPHQNDLGATIGAAPVRCCAH